MTPEKRQLAQHWIDELQHPSKTLTKWELGFLADVSDRLERTGYLADGTMKKLEEIYAEKTA